MQLVAVGINQSSAPLVVRERLSIRPDESAEVLARLRSEAEEGFVLSTCNRTELYAIAGHAGSGAQLLTRLLIGSGRSHIPDLERHLYTHAHISAARHLFRVAAGLDSMVLGEDQVVSQVKSALHQARSAGALGPRLDRLGMAALAASKRVRHETALGRSPVSVVSVALDLARASLGTLDGRRIVVAGAGRTAESVVRLCRSAAPGASVTIVNRTPERAAELARRCGVTAAEHGSLADQAADADLIITAVSAPAPLLRAADLTGRTERSGPLVVLDLSVPRAVDPSACAVPGVVLHDVDALEQCAAANRRKRAAEAAAAEAIIEQCAAEFGEWWRAREVAPAITRLRARAYAIRDDELERALARLSGLTERDQAVVRGLASRLINRLLHSPLTNLKEDPDGATLAAALDRLFTPANQ